jgi:hypothetical protein
MSAVPRRMSRSATLAFLRRIRVSRPRRPERWPRPQRRERVLFDEDAPVRPGADGPMESAAAHELLEREEPHRPSAGWGVALVVSGTFAADRLTTRLASGIGGLILLGVSYALYRSLARGQIASRTWFSTAASRSADNVPYAYTDQESREPVDVP